MGVERDEGRKDIDGGGRATYGERDQLFVIRLPVIRLATCAQKEVLRSALTSELISLPQQSEPTTL